MQSSKLTKTTWKHAREQAHKVNPELAAIIDEISPDDSYRMYIGEYPFGNYIVNKGRFLVPNYSGKFVPISETDDKEIQDDLSYNEGSNPTCLLLENSIEVFLDLDELVIPCAYTPADAPKSGTVLSTWKVINQSGSMQPAFQWDIVSGARSLLMLPKITDKTAHQRLKKEFNFQAEPPKRLVDHWQVFRSIYQGSNTQWHSRILYFSKKWFDNIDDPAWVKLKLYLLNIAWKATEYWRNKPLFNFIFSILQKNHQLDCCPYINDTVKHLLGIGTGHIHGLSPATDNSAGPIDTIISAYKDIYRLKNYDITIMRPGLLTSSETPVFYSLNYPIAIEFSPKNRKRSRALDELAQIKSVLERYTEVLLTDQLNISNSPLYKSAQQSQFEFYHGSNYLHGIHSPTKILEGNQYFQSIDKDQFPYSSIFFQGCIQIKKGSVG